MYFLSDLEQSGYYMDAYTNMDYFKYRNRTWLDWHWSESRLQMKFVLFSNSKTRASLQFVFFLCVEKTCLRTLLNYILNHWRAYSVWRALTVCSVWRGMERVGRDLNPQQAKLKLKIPLIPSNESNPFVEWITRSQGGFCLRNTKRPICIKNLVRYRTSLHVRKVCGWLINGVTAQWF